MTITLSDKSDDLRLGLLASTSSRLTNVEICELTEKLASNPRDLEARTRLLAHYNRLSHSSGPRSSELSNIRFQHMLWFVENAPDSKFSGEYHCFLDPNDANYFRLREAWLKQLKHSESLARRVNAFMFLLHGKEPDLSNRFKRMFSGYERSVHVQALDAFLKRSSTWVEKLARAQLERRLPPLAKVKRLTLFANDQELIPVAATAFGSATKAEFLESIERLKKHPEDMHARAIALGYTFSYHSFSPFELDPELTMLRFDQLCWVIRYIPGSQLAGNPFGMDPISHGPVGRFFNVDPLNEALASLWSDQIDKQIDDDRLLFNAAIFGQRTRTKSASKMISMQLRKTPLGKKMLSKAYSHY